MPLGSRRTHYAAVLAVFAIAALARTAEPQKFSADDVTFFEKEVKPLLESKCFKCHGGEAKIKGNLRLTSREGVLKGGDLGAAVNLEKPAESNLLKAINYSEGLEMPPSGKLPAKDIEVFTRWVKAGLPWTPAAAVKPPEHAAKSDGKDYWAYQPVKRPAVPAVKNGAWVQNPVDAFLLAKLEAKSLTPAAFAEPAELVRRMNYDLIGLPPSPEEVDQFVRDCNNDAKAAIEHLADRLLASPHYGEKWGRHWLDVVRYAETNGYERDGPKPFAWRFRDYVIRSFNDDKPYDRFVKEQLAGDELPDGEIDGAIATGYYRLGLWDDEPADPEQSLFDGYDDIVATTGQAFLAMTFNCARCHDHKGDPIPQADYYRLVAFFRDIQPYSLTRDVASPFNLTDISPPEIKAKHDAERKQREARKAELLKILVPIEEEAIKKMPAEDQRASEGADRARIVKKVPRFLDEPKRSEFQRMKKEFDELVKRPDPKGRVMALSVNRCKASPPATHLLIRGNPHSAGAVVTPAFPTALGGVAPKLPEPAPDAKTSGRRIALANWIASTQNPLAARVAVNRLWQHHFGRGIVASTNDFGKFGDRPTHPELLDWLADEFVRGGWTMKRMHKLLLTSNAYRMSSHASAEVLQLDPGNSLFGRFSPRRLNAEEVRDSMLAVGGSLDLTMYGPSIYPAIPKEVLAGQSMPGDGWPTSPPDVSNRRSIYVHVKRSLQMPILATHDQADTDSSCPVRYTTTVPTQALGMLNGTFTRDRAAALADRLRKEHPDDVTAQVKRAIRLSTGRHPGETEVAKDLTLIADLRKDHGLDELQALRQYCLLVLNANEFVYLD